MYRKFQHSILLLLISKFSQYWSLMTIGSYPSILNSIFCYSWGFFSAALDSRSMIIINLVEGGASNWLLNRHYQFGFIIWSMVHMVTSIQFRWSHVVDIILAWGHKLLGWLMSFLRHVLGMVVHPFIVSIPVGLDWCNSSPLVRWSYLLNLLIVSGDDTSHSVVLLLPRSLRRHHFRPHTDTLCQ